MPRPTCAAEALAVLLSPAGPATFRGLANQGTGVTDLRDIHDRDRSTGRVRDPEAHAQAVRAMFARISGVYDRMNHLLSLNLDRRWRRRVAAWLDPQVGVILDLCAGTGDLALACRAAGRGRAWVATDFTPQMLRQGRPKPGGEAIQWLAGDGLALPLGDARVDAVVVGFGVRNLADLRAGLEEMMRVLRPGGQLVVLDFFRADAAAGGPGRGPNPVVRAALSVCVPALGRLVAGDRDAYSYLPGSMDRFVSADDFAALLQEVGLEQVRIARQTLGIAHIVGGRKRR